jgi:hypothetical protein
MSIFDDMRGLWPPWGRCPKRQKEKEEGRRKTRKDEEDGRRRKRKGEDEVRDVVSSVFCVSRFSNDRIRATLCCASNQVEAIPVSLTNS